MDERGGRTGRDRYPACMSGATRSDRPAGRLRRIFDRLAPSQEDLHSQELRKDADSVGCTRIQDCQDRAVVTVTGTLRTVTLRPRAGVPALEAELFDGTAPLGVVWLGRRSIAGIEPGRRIIASGRVAIQRGRPVLFNPKYELRPVGQE
ncbi:DNA-binding protein [Streptomyces sp. ICBB 8177]|nr:DNA-binding protein [Streptomyces sp. ICBB 8177]